MELRGIRQSLLGLALIVSMSAGWFSDVEASDLQPVKGLGCYAYGDDETPGEAKEKAMARAREQAVSSYKVWVESSSEVEDFQLKKDSIHSISAGMLRQIEVVDVQKDGQEICLRIKGMLAPASVKEEVDRRKKQKVIKDVLMSTALNPSTANGVKVWLNKADGRYVEDDHLEVYIHSDRDAYLKLDYFQADGTVVHLVPNMFRKQAKIQKGVTYVFGGDDSPERFIISGPFGDEVIKALLSTHPFSEELQSNDVVSDSKTYVKTLEKGIQGKGRQNGTRGVRILYGGSASLFTRSQQIVELEQALKEQ